MGVRAIDFNIGAEDAANTTMDAAGCCPGVKRFGGSVKVSAA